MRLCHVFFFWSVNRISFSCLLPASWHFSLSSQMIPRLLTPSPRQLFFIGLVLCLMGLLYLLIVTGNGHGGWIRKEDHFHRWPLILSERCWNVQREYRTNSLLCWRHLARVTDVDATDTSNPNLNYGLVVDCGSSGSRVFVYCWPRHNGNLHELLNIQQMRDQHRKPVVMKIKPGNVKRQFGLFKGLWEWMNDV